MGLRDIYHGFVDLLRYTSLEIYLGAFLTLAAGGAVGMHYEYSRSEQIPISFSEKSQLHKDAERRGEQLGPVTECLTSVNDEGMKIFEAHNLSRSPFGNEEKAFARELEHHIDSVFKTHHYTLPDLANNIPKECAAALAEMKEYTAVMKNLGPVISEFQQAWKEDHDDVYHTECNNVCSTDSQGERSCHEECHQVYDHTIHTYTYYPKHGERATATLTFALTEQPQLQFPEVLPLVSKTNAEGEYIAEKSHQREDDKLPTEKDYLNWANTWNLGSTLKRNLSSIHHGWGALSQDNTAWGRAQRTAHSDKYNTSFRSDSGPREFQVAKQALQHAIGTQRSIAEIVNGLNYAQTNAPQIVELAKKYIAVTLDHKEGDADELEDQLLDTAKDMYTLNFKAGENLDQFRWWMVLLFALGSAVPGAGAGFLWDRWNAKKRWNKT